MMERFSRGPKVNALSLNFPVSPEAYFEMVKWYKYGPDAPVRRRSSFF